MSPKQQENPENTAVKVFAIIVVFIGVAFFAFGVPEEGGCGGEAGLDEAGLGSLASGLKQGCFVGASSKYFDVDNEAACTQKCTFLPGEHQWLWVDGNQHGNCHCVACACKKKKCKGTCVPKKIKVDDVPWGACECMIQPLLIDGAMTCTKEPGKKSL